MTETAVRIDKWLWAARCYKTRSQASAACADGHVTLNGQVARASAKVRPGDQVEAVCAGERLRILEVTGLGEKRGSASDAAELFIDHSPPPPPKHDPLVDPTVDVARGEGRPRKRDRRRYDDMFGW